MNCIAVDAASGGNAGRMEYRGVDTKAKRQLFSQGPFPEGTNNIGEFLALVHGLALLKKEDSKQIGRASCRGRGENTLTTVSLHEQRYWRQGQWSGHLGSG